MALVAGAGVAATAAGLAYLDAKFHFRKDVTVIRGRARMVQLVQEATKQKRVSLWYFIEENALAKGDREAIWSRVGCYSWSQLLSRSNQYAHWFISQGVKSGDLVAFMMINSPDFVLAWIALWAIGAAPAMINYHLPGPALLHCINISTAKLAIVDGGPDVVERVRNVLPELESRGMKVVDLAQMRDEARHMPTTRLPDKLREKVVGTDPFALFYTSGTTGMPKATFLPIMAGFQVRANNGGVDPDKDRYYICMPYYHGTGGIMSVVQLMRGITLCIAPRFSISTFWDDIRDSKATCFVYVGETLRYLVAAPPSPRDRDHNVHTIYGNGLRPDIWRPFRDRFGITRIIEFFNSTEGMFGLDNPCRGEFTVHAVGHHGLIQRWRNHDLAVPVEIDHETGDIIRDPETGFAIRSPYEVGGEILVAITPQRAFQGYFNNPSATKKKLVQDVFQKGDCFYRTGDSLRRDNEGRWYFLDRLGDTYRWKGENVSTAEVSECLSKYPNVTEAIVYGVQLPGHDGKAGVAAIYIEPDKRKGFDHKAFLQHIRSQLPRFAVPLFLRHLQVNAPTHNNKQNKVPLKNEGVDPENIKGGDEILWLDAYGKGDTYVPFTKKDWDELAIGKAKL